jgi:hypothetical protein
MAAATMRPHLGTWPGPAIDLDRLRRVLRTITAAFLGVPVALFAIGWLRPALAAAALAALGVALAGLAKGRSREAAAAGAPRVPLLALLLGLAPAAVAALVSGAGGLGPRNWDWAKHDAVLRDLVVQEWPVRYATESGTTALVYYVAYYLPAAATGKLAGWIAANAALSATSLAGTVLAVLWLVVLARGAPLTCGALCALFSGMDVLGALLVQRWPPHLGRILGDYHLEWWSTHWQYSSNASLLYFVPGQAIAGWLLVALLVDAIQERRDDFPVLALLAVGALWSPFVVVGMLPLTAAFLVARSRSPAAVARAQATAPSLAGAVLLAVPALYYASRLAPLALPRYFQPAISPANRGDLRLLPVDLEPFAFLAGYAVFVTCEFLVLWVLLLREHGGGGEEGALRPALLAAGWTLLVLPLFRYGLFNDLVMRASIPALAILLVASASALRRGVRSGRRAAIAAVLAIGALYGGNLLRMHLEWACRAGRIVFTVPQRSVRSLFQIQLHDPAAMRRDFVAQYLGAADAPFFRWLARPSAATEVDTADPLAGPSR